MLRDLPAEPDVLDKSTVHITFLYCSGTARAETFPRGIDANSRLLGFISRLRLDLDAQTADLERRESLPRVGGQYTYTAPCTMAP